MAGKRMLVGRCACDISSASPYYWPVAALGRRQNRLPLQAVEEAVARVALVRLEEIRKPRAVARRRWVAERAERRVSVERRLRAEHLPELGDFRQPAEQWPARRVALQMQGVMQP